MSKTLVEQLLENDIWNFWKGDWTKKIVVKWDGNLQKLKPHRKIIIKKLGRQFLFERSVSAAIGQGRKQDIIIK